MRRAVVALVSGLALVAAVLGGAATARAHAELDSSSPLDGEMLTALPTVIELTFTEPIGKPADLVLLQPDGAPVPMGTVNTLDRVMWADVDDAAAPAEGWYTVSYQVTSADGHLINGTTTFMLHTDGDTTMDAAAPPQPGRAATTTGADPLVVGVLVAGLAVALIVALGAVRRVLVGSPDASA